ncbi:MAG TPA: carbon-nitrogen hydrolase family protein [Phycisphaerae bacterium]|nr:carbon-nitrogen hydrolase family protein [Phycisphaerae bacterium]HUU23342.1 carbon-nitrogen hydrolase family protein [Phycisphaerae bacterium]
MAQWVRVGSVLFETKAAWGAPDAKQIVLAETAEAMKRLEGRGLDLVAFCEGVEAVGQTVEQAENPDAPGEFLTLYRDFAVSQRCHVAGSAKTRRDGTVYNSIVFYAPGGELLGVYDKVNLTVNEIEAGLTSGAGPVVVDSAIGRLGGLVCFDLNFEPLRQQVRPLRPDILVFASMYHGGLMQQMWAYDCRAYFVAAWKERGAGILDPFGRTVAETHCYSDVAIADVNLDRAMVHLDCNQERFDEIRRTYGDEVVIDVPPNLGPALIFSLTDHRTAADIVREFNLELIDDYLTRSLAANAANRRAKG